VPIPQAFFVQNVGKDGSSNAIALQFLDFQTARAWWAGIAGFAIARIGEGWCFFLKCLSFAAVIVALLMMRTS